MSRQNILVSIHEKITRRIIDSNVRRISSSDITIISNNCIGGMIYSDLLLKFNSPTINVFFCAPDFIEFLEKFDYHISLELKFSQSSRYYGECKYPVGLLGTVEIHFLHYDSFEEAKEKWDSRKTRIIKDKLYIIGSDRDFCSESLRNRFNALPFKNKVFFTSKYFNSPSFIWLKNYSRYAEVGDLIKDGKAWYFFIDLAKWFDSGVVSSAWYLKLYYSLYYALLKL